MGKMYAQVREMTQDVQRVARWKASAGSPKNGRDGKRGGDHGVLEIFNPEEFREKVLDRLVWSAVFSEDEAVRRSSRWLIRAAAVSLGAPPASIYAFYQGIGTQRIHPSFTVPAFNIRGLTYEVVQRLFRVAKKNHSGTFVLELARSELGYTHQSPAEYATCVLAAALKEKYQGPIFIQGDHYQFSAKKVAQDPRPELEAIQCLTQEAMEAGIFNIDIDASTLVDLSKPTLVEQQRLNYEYTATMTEFIRAHEPLGVTVSIGGEIGEVGKKNSTVEELRAFLNGYRETLRKGKPDRVGLAKLSVQTGTSHGGIPLADGTVAKVSIDFETLRLLSQSAREEYQLGGAVQHGASTLPLELFDKFPDVGTVEIHLATEFQNIIYETLPEDFKKDVYKYLGEACAAERQPDQTEEQFYYKTRKKAFGPFKKQLWDLPTEVKEKILSRLEERFDTLFKKLRSVDTQEVVREMVPTPNVEVPKPVELVL